MKFFAAIAIVFALFVASDAPAELVSASTIAERLGLSQDEIERVKKGEVVARNLEASSDKDLALAIVLRLDAPTGKVFDFVHSNRMSEYQTVRLSGGAIDPASPSLAGLQLPPDVVNELAGDPGGTFYMSGVEAEQISAAAAKGQAQVLDAYRALLVARARAYWEKGIAGITPYAGEGRNPQLDFAHANEVIKTLATNPAFLAELGAVPSRSPGKAIHELSWAVQKGRDKVAPVLIHRILYREGDGKIFAERHFYSGYDYDALQIVVGVLPIEGNRSAVFYTNHTYTAQVTGFGGGAKRSIGRKLLEKELVAELRRAQKVIPGK